MSKLDGASDRAKTGRSQCGGAEEGGSHFDRVVFFIVIIVEFFRPFIAVVRDQISDLTNKIAA